MKRMFILAQGSFLAATSIYAVKSQEPLTGVSQCPAWDSNWDFMQAECLVKPNSSDEDISAKKSKATRKLYLIRHGQYELDGKTDNAKVLTKLGQEQAVITGKHLSKLDVEFSNVYISTMERAKETGNIILNQIKDCEKADSFSIERSDMLREGHPINSIPYHRFKPDLWEFQDGSRIEAAFRRYFHRAHHSQDETTHEVMVCHANVIRYFICRAIQVAPERWLRMSLANGSVTEITIDQDGKVSVSGVGEKGFMPIEKITYT